MAIKHFLLNPTTILEMAAFTAAFLFLPWRNRLYPGAFVYYLGFVLLIEMAGFYFSSQKIPNSYLYNLLIVVQVFFFSWLFNRYQHDKKMKKIIINIVPLFLLVTVVETCYRLFNLPFTEHYNKYSKLMLVIMVLTYSFSFFVGLLKDDGLKDPLRSGKFWIVAGLFMFYLSSTPMTSFDEQVSKIKLLGNITFYTLVMGLINLILYGSWIIAFICLRKTTSSNPY